MAVKCISDVQVVYRLNEIPIYRMVVKCISILRDSEVYGSNEPPTCIYRMAVKCISDVRVM